MELLKRPTAEEAEQLRAWAEDVIALGYEGFEKAKRSLPGRSTKLMRFYMLPRSELHERLDKAIVSPVRESTYEENE